MNETFSILIDNHTRFETGQPGGEWLTLPTTAEQLHAAMQHVGITADNPQDFFINGFETSIAAVNRLTLGNLQAASVDELNYLAAELSQLDPDEVQTLNATGEVLGYWDDVHQLLEYAHNKEFHVLIPDVFSPVQLGEYYLEKSEMIQIPDEWAAAIDIEKLGQLAAEHEKGQFTEHGYILESGDEWEAVTTVPEQYHIMSYPQPTRPNPEKADMDAAPAAQAATMTAEPKEPRPVIPLVLNAENPAEKLKEITDRLEQGISELFESERYKEYLSVMSKFHNYSFNNTLLIAMQKPDASLIAGFTSWKSQFERNVKKGEKGIKIIAPSPFKVKKEMEKIDPQTQRPVIGANGKPVTEEQEVTIPAFKVVAVFDVSQTEGKELPDIAVDALTGDVDKYKDFFAALEKTAPVPVAFEKIEGGTHGYYHLEDKRIAIAEGMSELQTLKTTIHEIAHAKLHDIDLNAPISEQQNRPDRRTREVEAESIAYTVCQHYGLDTSDYSFGYVAGWSSGKELAELKSSLETIRNTAAELIDTIDGHMAEMQKVQTAEQEQPTQEEAPAQQPEQNNTFSIYQLKGGDETRDFRFEPYDRLHTAGLAVEAANYELTYTAPLESGMNLEGIFEQFNLDRPADFTGHSLSVSDVVVLHQDGQDTAHYVDSFGYTNVPEFLQPVPALDVEQTQETKQPETSVTYYPINETAARRAKEANSYSDYKPGSATAEYRQCVDEAAELAQRQKARVDPMHHEKIDRLLDTYARKLAENMNNSFAIESRVPSILIAGGSNFPVRKKEKQNAARDKNMEEWQDIKGLLDKIRSTGMGGISADDPNAIAKLENKLAGLEKSQETMKAVNAYYRKHKTLGGCTLMSPEQLARLTADMANRWYGRAARQPFEPYSLQNNNAEIRRTKARIEELTHREETPLTGWEFDGGKVEVNKEDNRLQVFFEEKPDEEKRTELKKGGFRWSPTAGAWQRQLNGNAFYAANDIKCIQPLTGERPTDLQRAHIRAEKAQEQEAAPPAPDNFLTGETVHTPRGNFRLTSMTKQEIEAAGYGFHHQSDDGKYLIMGNGTLAFAIQSEAVREVSASTPPENPLATVEQTTEQNYNMIDGVINNTPTVDELEAKVKAGEQISLTDLADAIKADKQRGGTPKEKPSIRAQLKADKEKATPKKEAKSKTPDLERS